MSAPVIQVERLSKKFRRGARPAYGRFSELLVGTARAGVRWARDRAVDLFSGGSGSCETLSQQEFWALRDVSFEVQQGEVLGIIGRNGAGKSTLLKLLSRITRPTAGEIRLRGRVGSLLEVGTGFHPELTGRENIYLNGTILGMRKREIDRKFDEIVAFAEIDQFLDTPVKHYSSGMYMRLAFAVAAHLEPEILMVDEVLAVGDAQFQKKCLGKMSEVAQHGRTVLFVSHNLAAVQSLCRLSLWVDTGTVRALSRTAEVVAAYLGNAANHRNRVFDEALDTGASQDIATMSAARIYAAGAAEAPLHNGCALAVEAAVRFRQAGDYSACMLVCRNGETAFVANSYHCPDAMMIRRPGDYVISFVIPPYLLNPGAHTISLYLADACGAREHFLCSENVLSFEVEDDGVRRGDTYFGAWPGPVCPLLPFSVTVADRAKRGHVGPDTASGAA